MEQTKKSKKPVIILAIVLVLVAAVLAIVYFATRPSTAGGVKTITVVVDNGEASESFELKTDAEYLGEALLENALVAGTQGELGLYIQTVNGITADEAAQEWWCLTKGGEQVDTGADTTPIADGEQFELTLLTGW